MDVPRTKWQDRLYERLGGNTFDVVQCFVSFLWSTLNTYPNVHSLTTHISTNLRR